MAMGIRSASFAAEIQTVRRQCIGLRSDQPNVLDRSALRPAC